MEIDATTFKPTQDGAFEVMVDKKSTRLVKESDLLAVKGSSEAKVNEWNTERASFTSKLAEASTAQETIRQQMLKEQAAKEQLMTKYGDYDTWKSKVGELTTQVETHKSTLVKTQEELASRVMDSLKLYGVSEESLKGKDLSQLRNLEDAAKLLGRKPDKQARYDGSGGGGASQSIPALESAKQEIQAAREKAGRH